jgi:hypothetical protein
MPTIRNYQGKLPKGIWYCDTCVFNTKSMNKAAAHIEGTIFWIYLIPLDEKDDSFEMHSSNINGVYLNKTPNRITLKDIERFRHGK